MPLKSSRDYIDDLSLSASTNSVLDWGSLANSFVSNDGVSTLSNTKGETVTKEGEYLHMFISPLLNDPWIECISFHLNNFISTIGKNHGTSPRISRYDPTAMNRIADITDLVLDDPSKSLFGLVWKKYC